MTQEFRDDRITCPAQKSLGILLAAGLTGSLGSCACGLEQGYLHDRADLPSTDLVWIGEDEAARSRELVLEVRGDRIDVMDVELVVYVVSRAEEPPPVVARLGVVGEGDPVDMAAFDELERGGHGYTLSLRADVDLQKAPFRVPFFLELERTERDRRGYQLEPYAIASCYYRPFEASAGLTVTWTDAENVDGDAIEASASP